MQPSSQSHLNAFIILKRNPIPLGVTACFPPKVPTLFSVSVIGLPILDVSYKWSHVINTWVLTGSFHWVECFQCSSMLWHVSVLNFFYYQIVFQCINKPHFSYPSVDEHLSCFYSWLFWIMLPWTSVYKFSCGHMFSFLLVIYLEMELLSHMIIQCLIFWEMAKTVFQKHLHYFTFPPAAYEGSNVSHSGQYLLSSTLSSSFCLIFSVFHSTCYHLMFINYFYCLLSGPTSH